MMKTTRSTILRAALLACAVSTSLAGCMVTTQAPPAVARTAPAGPAGSSYCQQSSDGKQVACGGAATYCEQSSDGHAVACGGAATYCEHSIDGHAVACGGQART